MVERPLRFISRANYHLSEVCWVQVHLDRSCEVCTHVYDLKFAQDVSICIRVCVSYLVLLNAAVWWVKTL